MIATVIDADRQPSPEGARDEPDRAFADVAREQLDGLYGYCVRLTNDRTDAEDLVQDTLLRAMRAYPGLRDEKMVKSWLFTIATNGWRDLCRARGRTLATVSLDNGDPEDDFSLFATLAIEDPFPYSDDTAPGLPAPVSRRGRPGCLCPDQPGLSGAPHPHDDPRLQLQGSGGDSRRAAGDAAVAPPSRPEAARTGHVGLRHQEQPRGGR